MLQFVTGSITGTGSDIDVDLGFKPKYVKVFNKTSPAALEWFEGMGDDAAIKHNQITDDGATTTNNFEVVSSDGITVLDSSSVQTSDPVTVTGFNGFQIPAAFQSDSDELYYIAGRN